MTLVGNFYWQYHKISNAVYRISLSLLASQMEVGLKSLPTRQCQEAIRGCGSDSAPPQAVVGKGTLAQAVLGLPI